VSVVLFLALSEIALGMAVVQCFIPRSALGPGFGKTIAAIAFFCLLPTVLLAGRMLPDEGSGPRLAAQGSGAVALLAWFAYFVALNTPGETVQRGLQAAATAAQAAMAAAAVWLLARHFHRLESPQGFGPGLLDLALSLAAGVLTSSLLLGSVVMAMLIGHWYLVIPGLSLAWLRGACWAFGGALLGRGVAIAYSLLLGGLTDPFGPEGFLDTLRASGTLPILAVRLLVGLIIPAAFCLMAYRSAAIRATQSATGILFPAVAVVLMGEVMGAFLTLGLGGLYV